MTEYGLAISGDEDKSVTGKIGSGQSKIELSSSNGDLRIKKGPAFPSLAHNSERTGCASNPRTPESASLEADKT